MYNGMCFITLGFTLVNDKDQCISGEDYRNHEMVLSVSLDL